MIIIYCTIGLNTYIRKLDERNVKKLGSRNTRCVTRVYGDAREGPPPTTLPRWMVALEFQSPLGNAEGTTAPSGHNNSTPPSATSTHHSPRNAEMDTTSYGPMYSFFEDSMYDEH